MAFNICPFCRRALPGGESPREKQDIQCPSCGAALCRIPDLSFPYGIRLPSTPQKKNRVACPYCKTHYSLNYTPLQGLVGCQSCLKIFALPPGEEGNGSGANKKIVPVNRSANTEEIPIRQGVIPNFSQSDTAPEVSITLPQLNYRGTPPAPPAPPVRPGRPAPPAPADPPTPTPPENKPFPDPPSNLPQINPSFSPALGSAQKENRGPSPGDPAKAKENPFSPSSRKGASSLPLQLLGNLLWLLLGGLSTAIGCFVSGALLCLTIIGIPFALQLFKIGKLELSPFGGEAVLKTDENGKKCVSILSIIMNILWIILGGWLYSLLHLLFGAILFCTVIGIPFALQHFKFASLMLAPFGKEVRRKEGALPTYVAVLLAIAVSMTYSLGGCLYKAVKFGQVVQKLIPENTQTGSRQPNTQTENDNTITID